MDIWPERIRIKDSPDDSWLLYDRGRGAVPIVILSRNDLRRLLDVVAETDPALMVGCLANRGGTEVREQLAAGLELVDANEGQR